MNSMNCYKILFCPKCKIFDCKKHVTIHFPKEMINPVSQGQEGMEQQPSNGNADADIPCKNEICWKKFQGPSRSPETILMEWNEEDRDYFNRLVNSWGKNYCMMGTIFFVKHCQQLHEYAKLVGERDASPTVHFTI